MALNWTEHRDQLNAQLRWQQIRNDFYGNIMWEQKNASTHERHIATGRIHFKSDASRERHIGKHEKEQADVFNAIDFYHSVVVPMDARIKQAYKNGDATAHMSALIDANDVVLEMFDKTGLGLSHRVVIENPAAALGSIRSEKKAAASRENGKKGGRPAMEMKTWCVLNNENGAFFGTVDAKTWKKALTLAYDVYSRDRRFTLDVISDAEYREKLGLSRP